MYSTECNMHACFGVGLAYVDGISSDKTINIVREILCTYIDINIYIHCVPFISCVESNMYLSILKGRLPA